MKTERMTTKTATLFNMSGILLGSYRPTAALIDDNMREMIIEKKSIDQIKEYALKSCGFKTLRDDAFSKVEQELTTLEEAARITTEE